MNTKVNYLVLKYQINKKDAEKIVKEHELLITSTTNKISIDEFVKVIYLDIIDIGK